MSAAPAGHACQCGDHTHEYPDWRRLDYPGGDIYMRCESSIERAFRVRACEKEPWTAAWLDTLNAGDRLFNIGANVGSYALIAAYRGADVLAVEAHPVNVAKLAKNAIANGLGGAITVVLAACSATMQPWQAGYGRYDPGSADLKLTPAVTAERLTPGIRIPGTTLDELAEVYGQPTHLLIDVDGGEVDVLRGGAEALAGVRDVMIELSTEGSISKGCTALLEAAGLTLIERWDTRGGERIPDVWYGLFRRGQPP